jgi:colanic acid/amylovoran biosynthesis protein
VKNLLIVQSYNANKGNASVLHAMKKTLLASYPDLDICLTAYDFQKAEQEYGIKCGEWILDLRAIKLAHSKIKKVGYIIREGLWIIYSLIWVAFYRLGLCIYVPQFRRKTIHLYIQSGVVVLPGGHLLTSLNSFITNLAHFYGLWFAISLGKHSMVYAETIGPFDGKWKFATRFMARYLLKHVDIVTVRDKSSLKYCHGLNNVHVTAECVFGLETDPAIANSLSDLDNLTNKGRLLVGAAIHHLYYRQFFSRDRYVGLMAEIFDRIVEEYDAEILIIPMEDAYHKGGDRPIAKEMIAQAVEAKHIHVLKGDHNCLLTCAVIAKMDVFVGTKTHSIVYGLKSGVPTISISYHDKSNDFMKMFGVGNHSINLKDLGVDDFMLIFNQVVANRARVRKLQGSALQKAREAALENNRLLISLFE